MNSFSEIWNNPKERTDLIIALIVCLLFGIGILSFLPTNSPQLADADRAANSPTEVKSDLPTFVKPSSSNDNQETKHSRIILTDKEVENNSKGFLQKSASLKVADNQINNNQIAEGENTVTSNIDIDDTTSEKHSLNAEDDKNTTEEIEQTLDSLSIADFQELEEDKSTTLQDSLDSPLEEDEETLEEITATNSGAMDAEQEEMPTENIEIEENLETEDKGIKSISTNDDTDREKESETTDKEDNKTTIDHTKTSTESTVSPSNNFTDGCIIVVGAFKKDHNAQKIIRQLKRKNYTVKTGWRKGLKYVGVPVACQDKITVNKTLQALRNTFDIEAWLLK